MEAHPSKAAPVFYVLLPLDGTNHPTTPSSSILNLRAPLLSAVSAAFMFSGKLGFLYLYLIKLYILYY